MIGIHTKLIMLAALLSTTSAFFLNWGSSNQEPNTPYPQYYYHQRVLQAPTTYAEPVPVPTIPVGVPLQAQLTPSNIHQVQLVPCLCPVSQDYESERVLVPSPEYVLNNQRKSSQ